MNSMTKDEKSLLMYLETRMVDYGGSVDSRRMNKDDFEIAEKWNEVGFIKFGRICFKDIAAMREQFGAGVIGFTHWCYFSDEAWTAAHEERKARASRKHAGRKWRTTEEYKEAA